MSKVASQVCLQSAYLALVQNLAAPVAGADRDGRQQLLLLLLLLLLLVRYRRLHVAFFERVVRRHARPLVRRRRRRRFPLFRSAIVLGGDRRRRIENCRSRRPPGLRPAGLHALARLPHLHIAPVSTAFSEYRSNCRFLKFDDNGFIGTAANRLD